MKRRLLSLFMTTVMILSCLPASAMAAPAEGEAEAGLLAEAADKEALRARVEELSGLSNEDGKYPARAWETYRIFYEIAWAELNDPDATQAEVNGALDNLNYYYNALGPGRPAEPAVQQFRLTAEKTTYVQEDDGVFTVKGSAPVTLLPQVSKEHGSGKDDDWILLDPQQFTFTVDPANAAKVIGNQVTAAMPGKFTVTAAGMGKTLKLELTSKYVSAQAVELKLSAGPWLIHERDDQGFKPFRIEDQNVVVTPENASYSKNWTLSVPENSGAAVSGREIRVDGPMDALTLTVTVADPNHETGKASGSFTAAVQYFNPVKTLTLTSDTLTVKTGESLTLPLTFTGEHTGAVSEPGMSWSMTSADGGEVTLEQGALDEQGVASPVYTLTGVKAGTVAVTGTPKDAADHLPPVTFTVTVKPEKTYPEIAGDRIDQISGQLAGEVNGGWTYGREWEIFGLVRSGQKDQLTQAQIDGYLDSVEAEFRSKPIHTPVEEGRVVMALGVLDQNAANFRGIDLIDRLTKNPETGASVYNAATALIALDSLHYFVPEDAVWTRDGLISALLEAQQPDGSLGDVYDTALAVQALAPYVQRATYAADATEPVNRAMVFLRTEDSLSKIFESPANATQMLMALSAMELDPTQESTGFIRNGKNLIDNLEQALSDPNTMMSEADMGLAICALNSYVRTDAGDNDVSDLTDTSKPAAYWQLQERVEAASGLNKTDYTADSWAALEQARAEADRVFNDPSSKESDLIRANSALKAAMNGLEKKPAHSGGPSEPVKPVGKTTTVEVEAKLDKDGVAVAEMSDAVAKKFAKDLAAGKDEAGAQAIVKVKTPKGAKGVSMTLPGAAMEALGKTEQTSLAINSEAGAAELSPEALSTAVKASGSGKLTMDIRQTGGEAQKTASQSVQDSIGGRPVYDVTLTADEQPVSQLGGDASIFVPYVPAEGENTVGLTVLYLNEEGEAVELTDARYDPELGGMVFDTTHFSIYAVALRDGGNMPFTDVKTTDWFYDEVGFVYSNRIMNGTTPTKFNPQGDTTRGMIVSILWRLEGKPAVSSRMKYRDVPMGTYYTEAVRWASYVGIVNGFTPTAFGPNASISRQQLAAILYRYAKFKGYDTRASGTLSVFRDAAVVSDYSREPLTWAISKGLMQGRADGTLAPQGTATRAHVAAILTRFTERVAK